MKTHPIYLQLRMSEMKTANPRIPSPLTAGIVARYCSDAFDALNNKQKLVRRQAARQLQDGHNVAVCMT